MPVFVVEYVIPSIGLVAVGAVLEAKFGAKLTSRVAALEAKVHATKAAVDTAVADAKKAV